MPTVEVIGNFLEQQARMGNPITYGRVLEEYPELPAFDGYWHKHPLCDIFGQIDAEDYAAGRPFRTALVHLADSVPGVGFFEIMKKYRGIVVSNSDQKYAVWIKELNDLLAYFKSGINVQTSANGVSGGSGRIG